MRLQRLFYCMVAGLAAAATIALILGDSGIVAYRRAAEYRDRLVGGIEEIEAAHRRLQRQLARFQSDAEAVRLAARELGYYRPGETVVSISEGRGRSAVAERGEVFDATYYSVGPLVHERLPRSHGGAKTLPMGFSFGALLFLTLLLFAGPTAFFLTIGASAVVASVAGHFLVEPEDSFAPGRADDTADRVALPEASVVPVA